MLLQMVVNSSLVSLSVACMISVNLSMCHVCTGVLLYFVDGVLPLVRHFFANLFSPPKEGDSRDQQLKITDRLLMNLLVCVCVCVCVCVHVWLQWRQYHTSSHSLPAEPL